METPFSNIDFSGQFGGRDAAAALLPHFKALKAAVRGVELVGFPFPNLTFILRVDGEINQYGLSGAGNVDIDKDGEYLSFDIGIQTADRGQLPDFIASSILSSVELIKRVANGRPWNVDFHSMQEALGVLCVRYRQQLDSLDHPD